MQQKKPSRPHTVLFYLQLFFGGGGAFALLLLALSGLMGQGSCDNAVCNFLRLEIIPRVEPGNSVFGLDTDCNEIPSCPKIDPTRQLTYDVYVSDFTSGTAISPYYLDYKSARFAVRLDISKPTKGGFSQINKNATRAASQSCPGATLGLWPSGILSPDIHTTDLYLSHDLAGCPPEPLLMDIYNPGSGGAPYRRAKLYTVVVDAYPGEEINIVCDSSEYRPNDGQICATDSTDNPSFGPFECKTKVTAYTVPAPVDVSQSLTLTLDAPMELNGMVSFGINLKNSAFVPRTITYLDFETLHAFNQEVNEPIIFSDYLNFKARDGNNWKYRFVLLDNPITLQPNETKSIAIIKVSPLLSNICWGGTLALVNTQNARIRTEGTCVEKPALPTTPSMSYQRNPNHCNSTCMDASLFSVNVSTEQVLMPCGLKVKIKLKKDPSLLYNLELNSLYMNVAFDATGDLMLTNVDTGSLGCTNCNYNAGVFSYYHTWASPFLLSDEAVIILSFTGAGCVTDADFTNLVTTMFGTEVCIPAIGDNDLADNCSPAIQGLLWAPNAPGLIQALEGAIVTIKPMAKPSCDTTNASCTTMLYTPETGVFGACLCSSCTKYSITPFFDSDILNGVNSWDLVLISRHILGLELLNTPYKIIGADANKSGDITTFDIIQLRKLLLGTWTELPNNTSWRFVDAKQAFINPANPFAEPIREKLENIPLGTSDANFISVKVGDVDFTAVPNNRPNLTNLPMSWVNEGPSKSKFLTLPIRYQGEKSIEALQTGFHFDPESLKFFAAAQGDIEGLTSDCFGTNHAAEGNIAMSWIYNPLLNERPLQQGDLLCYLSFKVLKPLPESGPPISLGGEILSSLAWESDGTPYNLVPAANGEGRTTSTAPVASFSAEVVPNPSSDAAQLILNCYGTPPQKLRVGIFGAFGNTVLVRDLFPSTGQQAMALPELANQPPGIYTWRVWSGKETISGIVVKQ